MFLKIKYYDSIDISLGINLAKSSNSKKVWFSTAGFLIVDSHFKIMYAMVVMICNVKH